MKKKYILDTNVLIDDENAIEVLRNGNENEIFIPFIVLDEVDKLKRKPRLSSQARKVINKIDEFKDYITFFGDIPSPIENPDDIIIQNILDSNKFDNQTFLVTNDKMLRIKAHIKEISAEEYKSSNPVESEAELFTGFIDIEKEDQEMINNTFFYDKGLLCQYRNNEIHLMNFEENIWKVAPLTKYQNACMMLLSNNDIPLVSIQSSAGTGKAQPLTAKVLTRHGFVEMGSLSIGSKVINSMGESTQVTAIYPQGKIKTYKLTFSDGTQTECCNDHLWNVSLDNKNFETLPLKDLKDEKNELNNKWYIPVTKPINFEKRPYLEFDPYIMGLFCEKRETISDNYLYASIPDRVALLNGILTKNTCMYMHNNSLVYTTTSSQLKNDICFLIHSLGGIAIVTKDFKKFNIDITLPVNIKPFRLKKDQITYKLYCNKKPVRYITDIKFTGEEFSQCITIQSKDHCYLTDDFIVTHNTFLSLAAGMKQVFEKKQYEKIIVIKPNIEIGTEMGFLPGNIDEKMAPFFEPIKRLLLKLHKIRPCNKLFIPENEKFILNEKYIEMIPLNFLRGVDIENAFVIVDEIQNITRLELRTLLSRMGKNVKCVCTGDVMQIDNPKTDRDRNALNWMLKKFKGDKLYAHITLRGNYSRGPIANLVREKNL